jgi:hypothetical protein
MIDTDRYKGYTNWDLIGLFTPAEMADEVLLLLAEVKRLRSILDNIKDIDMNWGIDFNGATITVTHFTGLMLSGELKLEMIE